MGLNIPTTALPDAQGSFGLGSAGISVEIIGADRAIKRLALKYAGMKRVRTVGVSRVSKYLLKKKKFDCKMGLYSGLQVGPNEWRFGWKYLGKPTRYVFTGSVLKSHKIGKRSRGLNTDFVDIVAGGSSSPHAEKIHGSMDGQGEFWYNERIKKLVKSRPWMKASEEESKAASVIIFKTYKMG